MKVEELNKKGWHRFFKVFGVFLLIIWVIGVVGLEAYKSFQGILIAFGIYLAGNILYYDGIVYIVSGKRGINIIIKILRLLKSGLSFKVVIYMDRKKRIRLGISMLGILSVVLVFFLVALPWYVNVNLNQVEGLINDNQNELAMGKLERILKVDTNNRLALLSQAKLLLDNHDFNGAKKVLSKLLDIKKYDELYYDALFLKWESYIIYGEGSYVEEGIDEYIKAHKENKKAIYYKALIKYISADYDQALEYLSASVVDKSYYNLMGLLYEKKGEYNLAISNFNKANEIDPDWLTPLTNKVRSLFSLSQYSDVIDVANQVLEINPVNEIAIDYKIKAQKQLNIEENIQTQRLNQQKEYEKQQKEILEKKEKYERYYKNNMQVHEYYKDKVSERILERENSLEIYRSRVNVYLATERERNDVIHILEELTRLYAWVGDYDTALSYCNDAIEIGKSFNKSDWYLRSNLLGHKDYLLWKLGY